MVAVGDGGGCIGRWLFPAPVLGGVSVSLSRRVMNRARQQFAYKGRKVVFAHVPKCGGTSADVALTKRFYPWFRPRVDYDAIRRAGLLIAQRALTDSGIRDDMELVEYLLAYQLYSGLRYVGGHFPVSARLLNEFSPDYAFVTLLRDPVERWKSNYLYNKRLPHADATTRPRRDYPGSIEDEFGEVISSGMGFLMGSLSCAMLAGKYPDSREQARELGAAAQANLGRFAVVGTLDRIDRFEADVSTLVGRRIAIGNDNVTRPLYKGKEQEEYLRLQEFLGREDTHSAIVTETEADRRLYAWATSMN